MRRPSQRAALLTLAALATLALSVGTSSAAAISAHPTFLDPEVVKAQAEADVDARGAGAEAPPGAVPLATPPPAEGPAPPLVPPPPNLLYGSRWWSTSEEPRSALAWVEAHPPGGLPLKNRSTSWVYGFLSGESIGYEWPPLPEIARGRLLTYSARTYKDETILRADSEATWISPHQASETIPTGARTLLITRERSGTPPHSELIDNRKAVRHFAFLLDSLPIAQPGVIHCPRLGLEGNTVTFVFRDGTGSKLAEASQGQPSSICRPMTLTIRGKEQPALLEGSEFLRRLRGVLP